MGRPAAEVFAAAKRGDPRSLAVVEEAARMVGLALMNLTNLVDPELIIIGGGITNSWSLVRKQLYEPIRTSPFITRNRKPKLLRAALGGRVGLVGAVEWARLNL
jgi:glucokinase